MDEMWTNSIMQKILDEQKSKRLALSSQLDEARETNLRREFEEFKAKGGKLPRFTERDSPGKRFSTTSDEYTTMDQFKDMPPPSDLRKAAHDRKMANWTAQIDFGSDKIEYITDARQGTNVNGFKESMRETQRSRVRAKELKRDLSRTQWELGPDRDSLENSKSTSIQPDPTGKDFSSYRGVLNKEVEKKIRRSVAFEGCLDPAFAKPNYKTVMQEGSEHHGNPNDFAAINKLRKKLKKSGCSQISFGDGEFRGLTTDYREGFKSYDRKEMEKSKGRMAPDLLKQLRGSTIKFGIGDERHMVTDSQVSNGIVLAALKKRLRDGGVDSGLESVNADNKKIKERLSRTTYRIGNDPQYMY